jgi:AraC family transcriptional regulator
MPQSTYRPMAEIYKSGKLAPYITGHRIARDHLQLFEAVQPPGDCSDPASATLTITVARSAFKFRASMGGGVFSGTSKPGGLVLTPPYVPSDILVDDPHKIQLLMLDDHSVADLIRSVHPAGDPFDFKRLYEGWFDSPLISSIIDRLWASAEKGDAVSRLYADGAAMVLVAELLRMADTPPVGHRGGLAPWQVRRATEKIVASAGIDVPLAVLAAEVGLSPFHFARAFKVSTGLPPHAWQMAQRIARAKALLESSDLPVTEIAFTVGYENSQAVARLFQRSVGMSPSKWRREHRR